MKTYLFILILTASNLLWVSVIHADITTIQSHEILMFMEMESAEQEENEKKNVVSEYLNTGTLTSENQKNTGNHYNHTEIYTSPAMILPEIPPEIS